jgi:hypothetical protein
VNDLPLFSVLSLSLSHLFWARMCVREREREDWGGGGGGVELANNSVSLLKS